MSKLNLPREDFVRKRSEVLKKFRSVNENFRKRKREIRADLEKPAESGKN